MAPLPDALPSAALRVVGCAGCGATLPVEPGSREVTCVFCGAERQLDAELSRALAELPEQAAAHEAVGLDTLGVAQLRSLRPGPPELLGAIGVGFSGMVLTVAVAGTLSKADPTLGGLVGLLGAAASLLAPAAWVIGLLLLAPYRTDRILARIRAEAAVAPSKGACPRCGAPVQIPPRTARLSCAGCEGALMAADGLLVAWVDDARERAEAWRAEASRVSRAHFRRTVRWSNVLGLASAGVPLVLMVSLMLCGGLLGAFFG